MAEFISYGGGVQSTAILTLLLKEPHLFSYPLPDLILFADTGAEPPQIYQTVDKMFSLLRDAGFQCETVYATNSNGDRMTNLDLPLPGRKSGGLTTPPWFIRNPDGSTGMSQRHCTQDFKINPITKRIREYLGVEPTKRVKDKHGLWLGISVDEIQRAKPSLFPWQETRFPLIDLRWNRTDCALYVYRQLGFVPAKSACYMCPFINEKEWMRRKEYEPELFAMAVAVDQRIRDVPPSTFGLNGTPYLHRSCQPIADISTQMNLFDSAVITEKDCGGHCWS